MRHAEVMIPNKTNKQQTKRTITGSVRCTCWRLLIKGPKATTQVFVFFLFGPDQYFQTAQEEKNMAASASHEQVGSILMPGDTVTLAPGKTRVGAGLIQNQNNLLATKVMFASLCAHRTSVVGCTHFSNLKLYVGLQAGILRQDAQARLWIDQSQKRVLILTHFCVCDPTDSHTFLRFTAFNTSTVYPCRGG
jgi:hypothetical protein